MILTSIDISGNTPLFFEGEIKTFFMKKKAPSHTSEAIAIDNAIISNPASILWIFFAFTTVISRLDRVNATPAGSFPSDDEVGLIFEYWALVFSRSPQVFKNFSKTFVGGLRSSNN